MSCSLQLLHVRASAHPPEADRQDEHAVKLLITLLSGSWTSLGMGGTAHNSGSKSHARQDAHLGCMSWTDEPISCPRNSTGPDVCSWRSGAWMGS